ncbi:hypothetical protein F5B22DRAFT_637540 [Xylaria bambusicola]|uniref:uncharacterized protein n=1 Tax=Xylaria bambusicola TaxID=326684 RepID=UPI00200744CD|nr:uncharacterized protein F5B22DRAFT_637540 [Xylaria bambusicola]KAI0512723.1 hypothetical protein F5B22DRAFT_637540 [Xylaria bambusicola]
MASYEARRLENIKRNESLVKGLGLRNGLRVESKDQSPQPAVVRHPSSKRPKLSTSQPTRISARIANATNKPNYSEDAGGDPSYTGRQSRRNASTSQQHKKEKLPLSPNLDLQPHKDIEALKAGWSSWVAVAELPTRDDEGNYHFESHPIFTPNKSPEAMIREGSFGGSYWRPLYSRRLRTTISDDWQELPTSWKDGISVERYLASPTYNPEVNKYGVACGQSIEEWEAAGWIDHRYDVRGWFQWYCRFWLGRRCEDDERQISRWRKCVGATGRWRRALLKKYVQNGVRTVTDEDDEVDEKKEVSPVVHQTCHHWAWEVRQEALDRFWSEGT